MIEVEEVARRAWKTFSECNSQCLTPFVDMREERQPRLLIRDKWFIVVIIIRLSKFSHQSLVL
jgi:hypothetical protein